MLRIGPLNEVTEQVDQQLVNRTDDAATAAAAAAIDAAEETISLPGGAALQSVMVAVG